MTDIWTKTSGYVYDVANSNKKLRTNLLPKGYVVCVLNRLVNAFGKYILLRIASSGALLNKNGAKSSTSFSGGIRLKGSRNSLCCTKVRKGLCGCLSLNR